MQLSVDKVLKLVFTPAGPDRSMPSSAQQAYDRQHVVL
jgi:hypothetical protein